MEPHIIEEREILKSYLLKSSSVPKPMGFLDRFEVRSVARDFSLLENLRNEDLECSDDSEMVGIECQDDMMLYFTGFLVLPAHANEFHSNPSNSSILEKEENRTYYLMCSPSKMWSFDYSDDLKGVWFENDNGWYKLLNPSKKYSPIYAPFKSKCDLWLALHGVLQSNFSATIKQVVGLLADEKYTEKTIFDNAQFILTNCSNTQNDSGKKFSSSVFAVELRKKITEIANEKKQTKIKAEPTTVKKRDRVEVEAPAKKTKLKKSSKKDSHINPVLLDSLNKAKQKWKKEAEDGNLSDSGDRNIIMHPTTLCNYCNKHRHNFIACGKCEEYQLCSVCFKNLQMDAQVKKKYIRDGKTAFDYVGENSLFTCRPCYEHQDESSSDTGSFNLDEES